MTGPVDQDSVDGRAADAESSVLTRRTLLGLVIALWSTGSLSDVQAIRLYYGIQGFGRFGYGGDDPEWDDE